LKIPRDISGQRLASLLERYGYQVTRQTGSHIRLTSTAAGTEHHVTIPAHRHMRIGTLSGILGEIAAHMETTKERIAADLFGP